MLSIPANSKPSNPRLGLIGAGRWGRVWLKVASQSNAVELSAVASSNPDTLTLLPKQCQLEADWRTFLTDADIDGVIVATPPASHAEICGALLDAGKAVLVEKPLTPELDEAHMLFAQAKARQSIIFVNHVHLFHPAYQRLKAEVGARPIGLSLTTGNGNWGPFRRDTSVLWDWGPHEIAIALDLMGTAPVSVTIKRLEEQQTEEGYGERLRIELGFSAGSHASIEIGNLMEKRTRLVVAETKNDRWIYDEPSPTPLVRADRATGVPVLVPIETVTPLECALSQFSAAIRSGSPQFSSMPLSVDVVRILTKCEKLLQSK